MNDMKPAKAFRKAMKIIEDADAYAEGASHALSKDGRTVAFARDRSAVKWSLFSAIEKATGYWNNSQCYEALLAVAAAGGVTEVGQLGKWAQSLSHEKALSALNLAAEIEESYERKAA